MLGLLARDPGQRIQRIADAEQARGELEEVLRRSGQHVGEHEVSAWMRGQLPRQFIERVRRERECLRALAPLGRPPPVQADAPVARWRRMAVSASVAVLVGAAAVAVGARSSDHGSATPSAEGGAARSAATTVPAAPAPVVSPLVPSPPAARPAVGSGATLEATEPATRTAAGPPAPVRRRRRRPRRSEVIGPATYIPLPGAALQRDAGSAGPTDGGTGSSPDAGAPRAGGSGDPRTDNLDPWNR